MSLTLNGSGWLEMAWAVSPGLPLTIAVYVKQNSAANRIAVSSGTFATEAIVLECGSLNPNGYAYTLHRTSGSSRSAVSTFPLTNNAWTLLLAHGQTASPGTELVYGPSSTAVTESSTRTAVTHTRFRVGASSGTDTPSATNFIGDIAEVVIWKGLTQAQAEAAQAAIAGGALPETVQTAAIFDVWDLQTLTGGNYVGRVNGNVLTTQGSGTTQGATHPITRSAGGATAAGATMTATSSLVAGSASGTGSANANGVTLTGTASLVAGSASGAVSGTLTIGLTNNTSAPLPITTIPRVTVQKLADGAGVLNLTSQTSDGSANLIISSASLVPGTDYIVNGWNADGSNAFIVKATAA